VVRLKACLNGGRQPGEHPAVPRTPGELAASALDAVRAGADALHLHPRNAEGAESLRAEDIAAAVAAVRGCCPGVPVGVSTGLWITGGNVLDRQVAVAGWAGLKPDERPDFASVNLSEPGAVALAATLAEVGVAAEAGVWSVADARILSETLDSGLTWLRILIEMIDVPASNAVATADRVLAAVHHQDPNGRLPILLHGEADACWPLIEHAARLGLATRVGLEDTLTGPNGEPARDNAHLVSLAAAYLS
jgi:uncharacterized protein (DUF849 family)